MIYWGHPVQLMNITEYLYPLSGVSQTTAMAALLCTIPCQAIGQACALLIKGLSESCKCLADVVRPIAAVFCDFSRPFSFVVFLAVFVLGTPSIMVGMALANDRCSPIAAWHTYQHLRASRAHCWSSVRAFAHDARRPCAQGLTKDAPQACAMRSYCNCSRSSAI